VNVNETTFGSLPALAHVAHGHRTRLNQTMLVCLHH